MDMIRVTGEFRADAADTGPEDDVLLFDEVGQYAPGQCLGGQACDVEGGVLVFIPNWTKGQLEASSTRTRRAWGIA